MFFCITGYDAKGKNHNIHLIAILEVKWSLKKGEKQQYYTNNFFFC